MAKNYRVSKWNFPYSKWQLDQLHFWPTFLDKIVKKPLLFVEVNECHTCWIFATLEPPFLFEPTSVSSAPNFLQWRWVFDPWNFTSSHVPPYIALVFSLEICFMAILLFLQFIYKLISCCVLFSSEVVCHRAPKTIVDYICKSFKWFLL